MTPFFSIIIPLFNKEKYIQNTIESVLKQSFQDFEIVIINDGSTDNSLFIINHFKDERIKIVTQKNRGVASARNKGIELAEGKIIAFLDADDNWLPNHLQEIFELSEEKIECGMFCSRYTIKIKENHFEKVSFKNNIADNYKGIVEDFFKTSLKNRVALTSALAVKKEVFEKIGLFNESYSNGEDTNLWIKIALNYKIAITNKVTCIYNFASNNMSKNTIINQKLSDFKEFENDEKNNQSLKQFLDVYRLEYALKYKVAGNNKKSKEYLKNINPNSIPLKTKVLLNLPSVILQILLKFKHFTRQKGYDFSVYK